MSDKQYDNTNRGVAFKKEKTEDWHPDMTGSINVEGVEYFLDVTVRESERAGKYLTFKVKRKEKQSSKVGDTGETKKEDFDETLPF